MNQRHCLAKPDTNRSHARTKVIKEHKKISRVAVLQLFVVFLLSADVFIIPWLYVGIQSTGRKISLRSLLPVATEKIFKKNSFSNFPKDTDFFSVLAIT